MPRLILLPCSDLFFWSHRVSFFEQVAIYFLTCRDLVSSRPRPNFPLSRVLISDHATNYFSTLPRLKSYLCATYCSSLQQTYFRSCRFFFEHTAIYFFAKPRPIFLTRQFFVFRPCRILILMKPLTIFDHAMNYFFLIMHWPIFRSGSNLIIPGPVFWPSHDLFLGHTLFYFLTSRFIFLPSRDLFFWPGNFLFFDHAEFWFWWSHKLFSTMPWLIFFWSCIDLFFDQAVIWLYPDLFFDQATTYFWVTLCFIFWPRSLHSTIAWFFKNFLRPIFRSYFVFFDHAATYISTGSLIFRTCYDVFFNCIVFFRYALNSF